MLFQELTPCRAGGAHSLTQRVRRSEIFIKSRFGDSKFVNNFHKSLLGISFARMYQLSSWELLSLFLRGSNYLGQVSRMMWDLLFQKTPLSTGEDFVCVLLYFTYSALDKPILLVLKVILHFYYEAQNIGPSSCGELTSSHIFWGSFVPYFVATELILGKKYD